jgi:hypothetical protein
MPSIDETSEVLTENSQTYYQNTLNNSKILLFQIDKAIFAITSGGHHSYTINSGQSTQTVTRENIAELIKSRDDLLYTISTLEERLNIRKSVIHAVPGW